MTASSLSEPSQEQNTFRPLPSTATWSSTPEDTPIESTLGLLGDTAGGGDVSGDLYDHPSRFLWFMLGGLACWAILIGLVVTW